MYCQCNKCSNPQKFSDKPIDVFEEDCPTISRFPPKPCCCRYQKKKVKGRFGVAYVLETPKTKYCKPFGWQVEFEDTPSRIDHSCKKMVKWVTSPPLGECSNAETNFWCFPEECGEFLKNETKQKCRCVKQPVEQLSVIEGLQAKCICSKEKHPDKQPKLNCSNCQNCCSKKERRSCCYVGKSPELLQKCSCFAEQCCYCMKRKESCVCFENDLKYCKKCKSDQKCVCKPLKDGSVSNYGENDLQCKYCKSHKCSTNICRCCPDCYMEQKICTFCGKVVEKNYFVKKSSCDDVLDMVPNRECDKIGCRSPSPKPEKNEKKKEEGTEGLVENKEGIKDKPTENRSMTEVENEIKTTTYDEEHPSLLQKLKKARRKQKEVIHPVH